ncbi:hypothetical protein J6X15_00645 [Candidatus Saccharibacteria bacterium]|nr:hypothetical protein [Candidatus Saccharibacteria bacterium]
MGKTFVKIDAESRLNKLGQLTKWEDMQPSSKEHGDESSNERRERILREQYPQGEDESQEEYEARLDQYRKKPREYWSEEAIRERSLEEQYPQIETESDEEYKLRLELIGEAVLGTAKTESYVSGGNRYFVDYKTTESAGKKGERTVYHGHRFEELEPDIEDARQYQELFGETRQERRERTLKQALEDSEAARNNPGKFPLRTELPRVYEYQMQLARHYVGALNREEKGSVEKGIFEGFGEDRYSPEDADRLLRAKQGIDQTNEESDLDMTAYDTGAKIFEGFFYPFTLQGFFDFPSKGGSEHASVIVPSEYDDIFGKVDAAVEIPMIYKDKDGSWKKVRMPICFDLTTGTGDGKVNRIANNFRRKHGFTDIKYPSSCTGEAIEPLDDVPHFALCIDSLRFGGFKDGVAMNGKLPQGMNAMIDFQIQQQASLAAQYWGKRKGGEEKAQQMALLADYFLFRLQNDLKAEHTTVRGIQSTYRDSFRYLSALK